MARSSPLVDFRNPRPMAKRRRVSSRVNLETTASVLPRVCGRLVPGPIVVPLSRDVQPPETEVAGAEYARPEAGRWKANDRSKRIRDTTKTIPGHGTEPGVTYRQTDHYDGPGR